MAKTIKPIQQQVQDYMDYCKYTCGMSEQTLRIKKYIYRSFMDVSGCRDLRQLTNAQFQDWVKYLKDRGVTNRTMNMRTGYVLAMLRYYQELGYEMPINLTLIKKFKEGTARRGYYSREQIDQVIKHADDMSSLMIRICFDAGLRINELRNLRVDSFRGRRFTFIGKGHKAREGYITKTTEKALRRYIKKYGITDWLWLSQRGNHMSVAAIRVRMRKPFEELGYEDFYPHALRHSFATDLQKQGASILEIQQMIGHADASTTQRYMHGLEGHLEELFNKYR